MKIKVAYQGFDDVMKIKLLFSQPSAPVENY